MTAEHALSQQSRSQQSVSEQAVSPDTLEPGSVLILGGTGEARALACALYSQSIPIISSLAGRVRAPRLPEGPVRVGGFGGVDGLSTWLHDNHIGAVVDATHPFASTITEHAAHACARAGKPLLRVRRQPWIAQPDDRWTHVADIHAAAAAVDTHQGRILLTTGRQDVDAFSAVSGAWFLIRVVDPPTGALPARHQILQSRGPYHFDAEYQLLQDNRIDMVITKNSGGGLTRPKLDAARELGIPVIMVDRPAEPAGITTVDDAQSAVRWVVAIRDAGHAPA